MKDRVRVLNDAPVRSNAAYVLYWARMNRRVAFNHALAHAAQLANELELPLLYYEELDGNHPDANDRSYTFILEGVPDTAASLKALGIGYCFHLRRAPPGPEDALFRVAGQAAAIVTDDYPKSIGAERHRQALERAPASYQVVDSSCIVPMSAHPKRAYAAYTIRPRIERMLPQYLEEVALPELKNRWQGPVPKWHEPVERPRIPDLLASLEIDHGVPPSISYAGGTAAARKHLRHFLRRNLHRYAKERNQPTAHATSKLSPYLHFGHISSLEVALEARSYAKLHNLSADAYLEELIVRRELAFNYAAYAEKPDSLANLPEWARHTLLAHAPDERGFVYSREQFEAAATHDALWNATEKELLLRGTIHGYYRMYWGKKIIEWSRTCQDALETMVYLHDRYALDGRDPNTYTNILWCFGLHDRPWKERPVFGMVRYMSFEGMKRKTDTGSYIREVEQLEQTGNDPFRVG